MIAYRAKKPLYNIYKSWEENYKYGPEFTGPYPVQETERKWEFLGKKLISPLGVAAGPLPNSKWMIPYIKLGYGSVIQKTVRSQAHKSHQHPNVLILNVKKINAGSSRTLVGTLDTPSSIEKMTITNSFGNPCYAPKIWMEETKKAKKTVKIGQLLGVSVYGSQDERMSSKDLADDYANVAKMAKSAGAMFIEANLACPNVLGSEDPFLYKNKKAVAEIARAIKSKIGNVPLLLKIGYFESYKQLEDVLKASGRFFDGISAINTISKKIVDKKGNQALPGRDVSGVCGYAIKEYGVDMVKKLKKASKDMKKPFEIIGVGGVMKPQDVLDYLDAGANHVNSATAVMWNPYLAYELQSYLKNN